MIYPTLSIVAPYNCNAKCSFCSLIKCRNPIKLHRWFSKLDQIVDAVGADYNHVIITGGEPSLFPSLNIVLQKFTSYRQVEVRTNASGFIHKIDDDLLFNIDHLNIIRHAVSDEVNERLFGTKQVPKYKELEKIISRFKNMAVKTTLTKVIHCTHDNTEFLMGYLRMATNLGVDNVRFVQQTGSLMPTPSEHIFMKDVMGRTISSPIYKQRLMEIDGLNVTWESGLNGAQSIASGQQELIYYPDGRMYKNWDGSEEVALESMLTPSSQDEDESYYDVG